MRFFKKLLREESGQDLAEYAIALAVIGVGAGAAAVALAGGVHSIWSVAASVTSVAAAM